MKYLSTILVITLAISVYANCGCLKCNKNLQQVSPPGSPMQIIMNGASCCCNQPKTIGSYSVQVPVQTQTTYSTRILNYQVQPEKVAPPASCCQRVAGNVKVQVPAQPSPKSYMIGLKGKTDRMVITPNCPPEQYASGPIYQSLESVDYYTPCSCRYGTNVVFKRNLDFKNDEVSKQYFYSQKQKIYTFGDRAGNLAKKRSKRALNWNRLASYEEPVEQIAKIAFPRKIQPSKRNVPCSCQAKPISLLKKAKEMIPKCSCSSYKPKRSLINNRNPFVQAKPKKLINPFQPKPKKIIGPFVQAAPKKLVKSLKFSPLAPKNFIKAIAKATTFIAKWLVTPSPVDPPELQFPNYDKTKNSKNRILQSRNMVEPKKKPLKLFLEKRSLKNTTRSKRALRFASRNHQNPRFLRVADTNPNYRHQANNDYEDEFEGQFNDYPEEDSKLAKEPFLKPFNVEHILHPTSMIHVLNTPIRYLNHVHEVRNHISPVVETIPKIVGASKNYIMDVVKNFGRRAFVLTRTLMAPFAGTNKLRRKFRFKRSVDETAEECLKQKHTIVSFLQKISVNVESDKPKNDSKKNDSIEVKAIKGKISDLKAQIAKVAKYSPLTNQKLYTKLIYLQNNKTSFVEKWKISIINKSVREIFNERNNLLQTLNKLQTNKQELLKEIINQLNQPNEVLKTKLIKILARLQKIQFLTKILYASQDEKQEPMYLKVFEKLTLISSRSPNDVSDELAKDKTDVLQSQIDFVQFLTKILELKSARKIKQEAQLVWEINNIEKLQNVSIKEINKNIKGGFGIHQELKILFDLQKQLEDCLQRQNVLIKNS